MTSGAHPRCRAVGASCGRGSRRHRPRSRPRRRRSHRSSTPKHRSGARRVALLPSVAVTLGPDRILLHGRVAIVTGAAAGIGRATALALARFGSSVAMCDRDGEGLEQAGQEVTAIGRPALTDVFDVRDRDAVEGFVSRVADELGPADVLVNNAGGGFHSPFLEVSAKGEDALVHENFSSVTSFIRAVVPRVPETGGSVINITS